MKSFERDMVDSRNRIYIYYLTYNNYQLRISFRTGINLLIKNIYKDYIRPLRTRSEFVFWNIILLVLKYSQTVS